jgi:nudix-type nucleoside diphosphatase (YffH/AdpP family)
MASEIIDVENLYHGWVKLRRATVRTAKGEVAREIEDHGDAACVMPYDPDAGLAMLVRQLRAPVLHAAGRDSMLEAIAGIVDEGEEPSACATREAMEEAGVTLERIEPVTVAWTMPGISTERMHFFLAHYRAGAALKPRSAEDQAIEVVEMALDDLARRADSGQLDDLKTLLLVQTLRLRQPRLFG